MNWLFDPSSGRKLVPSVSIFIAHCSDPERHAYSGRPTSPRPSPDIEANIHLFKTLVKRNAESEHTRAVEFEADQAEPGFAVVEVEFGAGGDERREQRGIDRVVEHHEVSPIGGQKRAGAGHVGFIFTPS